MIMTRWARQGLVSWHVLAAHPDLSIPETGLPQAFDLVQTPFIRSTRLRRHDPFLNWASRRQVLEYERGMYTSYGRMQTKDQVLLFLGETKRCKMCLNLTFLLSPHPPYPTTLPLTLGVSCTAWCGLHTAPGLLGESAADAADDPTSAWDIPVVSLV
ncbi:hypothetical protein RRG08_026042 [Elysia crispata]|uniref:Uncharacterized protein n=1 Tax=Elysia crispata TaxID=231223 RepID=A0AAE1D7X1_9GAST|nr:hypothetical protein RRG08_026042 [Elysia crispata]